MDESGPQRGGKVRSIASEKKSVEYMPEDNGLPDKKWKAWAILLSVLAGLWIFAIYLGPWMETRIPVFDEIVRTIEKDDIDSGAYFYTEIKGAYEGERYLRNALELGEPDQARFTPLFCSGIFFCIAILALGWRYLPND